MAAEAEVKTERKRNMKMLHCWLWKGGNGHEKRNVGSLWKLEKARKWIFLLDPPEEWSPADTLVLIQSNSFWTSDLQSCKIIKTINFAVVIVSIYRKNVYLVTHITKIYFLYTFGLPPQYLAHSSSNPMNFWSGSAGIKVSFVMWMSDFWKVPEDEPVEPSLWSEGGNSQPHPYLQGVGGAGGWTSHDYKIQKDQI